MCGVVEAQERGGVLSRVCDRQSTSAGPGPSVTPLTSILLGLCKDSTGSIQLRKTLLSTYCMRGSELHLQYHLLTVGLLLVMKSFNLCLSCLVCRKGKSYLQQPRAAKKMYISV